MTTAAIRHRGDVAEALDRRWARLLRRLGARSVTLREATTELHNLYLHRTALAAVEETTRWGPDRANNYVAAAVLCARVDVDVDELASEPVLRLAERRLGEVLTLPTGERVGARPVPPRPYDRPEDLW